MKNEEHQNLQHALAQRMYKAPADLVRNVAALDDRVLMSADVNLLRATLREFRDQARAIADG